MPKDPLLAIVSRGGNKRPRSAKASHFYQSGFDSQWHSIPRWERAVRQQALWASAHPSKSGALQEIGRGNDPLYLFDFCHVEVGARPDEHAFAVAKLMLISVMFSRKMVALRVGPNNLSPSSSIPRIMLQRFARISISLSEAKLSRPGWDTVASTSPLKSIIARNKILSSIEQTRSASSGSL
jgi:hypothetical protein